MSADQLQAAHGGLEEFGEGSEALFNSDEFRMTAMKVLPCSKRFVHDWTECPFAHPQEKARRRDPRVHNYTGIACPSMKKEGCCAFGDHCPYAHNVFEYWLHPTRYRTQLCNDGSNCKRRICFFAHSLDELRVPACKPFVSPEALASAAAAAAADAEAKRKAATIGSPLSAFAALSPGPPPQRASLDTLRSSAGAVGSGAGMGAPEGVRLSGASVAAPASPTTTDEGQAGLGSSPADTAVHQALQQLSGAGFSAQEQQVIELVTSLLAQDKVSPEQAASILQQMLPAGTLNQLQAHLTTPRSSLDDGAGRYSGDVLYQQRLDAGRSSMPNLPSMHVRSGGFEPAQMAAAQQGLTLEQMAALQAAQSLGITYQGGMPLVSHLPPAQDANPRMSVDSLRSSFDTGALLAASAVRRSNRGGSDEVPAAQAAPAASLAAEATEASALAAAVRSADGPGSTGSSSSPAPQDAAVTAGDGAAAAAVTAAQEQQQPLPPSVEAALRRLSAEQAVGFASQQQAALLAAAQQRKHHALVLQSLLQRQQQKQQHDRAAVEAALQQRRQLLQLQHLHQQQLLLQQQQAARAGPQTSEESSRMSFETGGRGSMDMLGTPRASVDATYPPTLLPTLSGSYPGQVSAAEGLAAGPATPDQGELYRSASLPLRRSLSGRPARFYSGQLSSVPEQFPMINAPPPSSSWSAGGVGRYSLDSAADRLSEDLSRLSFEASARAAPQPTANPYASSFFSPSGGAAPAPAMGMPDRLSLNLPPLAPVRTSAPARSPGLEEEAAGGTATAAAQQHQQQLLGGTALQRLH